MGSGGVSPRCAGSQSFGITTYKAPAGPGFDLRSFGGQLTNRSYSAATISTSMASKWPPKLTMFLRGSGSVRGLIQRSKAENARGALV